MLSSTDVGAYTLGLIEFRSIDHCFGQFYAANYSAAGKVTWPVISSEYEAASLPVFLTIR